MTITPITSKSDQVQRHQEYAISSFSQRDRLHVLLCQDLLHAANHGDVSLCQDIYNKLGGDTSHERTATMKAWFFKMSGGQMTATKGVWGMKPKWTKEKFLLDKAEKEGFWTLGGEKAPGKIEPTSITDMIARETKKILAADDDGVVYGKDQEAKYVLEGNVVAMRDYVRKVTAAVAAIPVPEKVKRIPAAVKAQEPVKTGAPVAGSDAAVITEPEGIVVAA